MTRIAAAIAGHWQLIALLALICLLWPTRAVIPLKILVVFLHELSHALAAILTGGKVESLTIDAAQGGMVTARGGNRFITLTAGYLGSLLFGLALTIAAVRTHWDRGILGLLGAALLAVAALYIRDGFALAFTLVFGTLMLGAARFLPRVACDLALRVIGLTSVVYVPLDIFSDTIARAHLRSDAAMLAQEFGGTTVIWGGLWLALALIATAACIRYGLGAQSNIPLRLPKRDHST